MLTFLAGAELEPDVLKTRWEETLGIELVAFLAPFLGHSVAVVYAVMLELGLNKTEF